jgi:CheY-like chemotaxis protein
VFVNLISNAIKFTNTGESVSVKVSTTDDYAEVRVSDTGQGIASDTLPNIFRQFLQGDPNRDVNKGGLGLGLSIVNILVAKHGGSVVAESAGVGKGSTFIVKIPLKTVDRLQNRRTDDVAMPDVLPLRGLNVMVVEDDNDSREVLQLFLEQAGATVEGHSSARSAMDRLATSPIPLPDIIISDLAMPEEDGYSLIGRIRDLPRHSGGELPALALSAFATNESKQRALDAGFDHYCTKPFEPDELTRDILKLTRMKVDSGSPAAV